MWTRVAVGLALLSLAGCVIRCIGFFFEPSQFGVVKNAPPIAISDIWGGCVQRAAFFELCRNRRDGLVVLRTQSRHKAGGRVWSRRMRAPESRVLSCSPRLVWVRLHPEHVRRRTGRITATPADWRRRSTIFNCRFSSVMKSTLGVACAIPLQPPTPRTGHRSRLAIRAPCRRSERCNGLLQLA